MVRIDDGVVNNQCMDRVVLCVDYENEVKNTDCMGRKKVGSENAFGDHEKILWFELMMECS